MNNQVVDVLVLGGGPSGLTAGIYTGRAGLSTLLLAGNPPGGQLMWSSEVENFPGFPEGITGPELIMAMRQQAEKFGVQIVDENVRKVSGSFEKGFGLLTDEGKVLKGRTLIVAAGASARWLELPSEQKLRGKGVSACAVCDGFFFKNKVVAVVGGGDVAFEEALYLTKFAGKVYLLIRGGKEQVKACKALQDKVRSNAKIELKYHTEVVEVLGSDVVTGLKIKDNSTCQETAMDDVRGLFVAIGHKPNTEFLVSEGVSLIALGKFGYAEPQAGTQTHTIQSGVFVAGDVSDHRYRQAITAAGFGCMAALDCIRFLSEKA
ncbi:NAD(P)/FAD-dependent oxidoreductase [Patescibacteria group bacterium]|nr:NAD(P)/FAD-dependent oxidoreductase [Patescibacteria group bacterium]